MGYECSAESKGAFAPALPQDEYRRREANEVQDEVLEVCEAVVEDKGHESQRLERDPGSNGTSP